MIESLALEFSTQDSTTMSAGIVQEFHGMPYTYHLKDFNNHNTFFGTDSHLQSISRFQCHNVIQITSLKLLKSPGLSV